MAVIVAGDYKYKKQERPGQLLSSLKVRTAIFTNRYIFFKMR